MANNRKGRAHAPGMYIFMLVVHYECHLTKQGSIKAITYWLAILFQMIKMLSVATVYQAIGHFLAVIHLYRYKVSYLTLL